MFLAWARNRRREGLVLWDRKDGRSRGCVPDLVTPPEAVARIETRALTIPLEPRTGLFYPNPTTSAAVSRKFACPVAATTT